MNIKRVCQFLLDKEPGKSDAKVRYRIKWNNNRNIVSFGVGYRVDIDKWSLDTQRCKNNTTHGKKKVAANIINREITRFEQIADDVFEFFALSEKIPSAEEFRNEYNKRNGKAKTSDTPDAAKSFFGVFDEFTKTMGLQNSWAKATYTKFNSIKLHLGEFNGNLSFEKLSSDVLNEFIRYMYNVPLRNTTIAKNVAFLKWFLRWAHQNGYYAGMLHETFKPKLKGTDGNNREVIHLTWEELLYLYVLPLPKEKQYLARVRDVFCFCCFPNTHY